MKIQHKNAHTHIQMNKNYPTEFLKIKSLSYILLQNIKKFLIFMIFIKPNPVIEYNRNVY